MILPNLLAAAETAATTPAATAADWHGAGTTIPLWLVGPFALLLLLIAVMPLTPHRLKHLWERGYPVVAILLGGAVAAYYLLRIPHGGHTVVETLHEYTSFIALIGSLFVVAGGIHISIRGEATPTLNVVFLLIASALANLIGTTGASMVFIRPWIRMNKYRITAFHIVFFIFTVSNIGGALTPIGDPPLFLGFLHGVPFFWLIEGGRAVLPWAVTLGAVLAVFYVMDRRNFLRAPGPIREKETGREPRVRVEGMRSILFLFVVLVGVFLPAAYFIRELTMIGAAYFAFRGTPAQIHQANDFTFAPIKEVAFLFFGIFLTMMPALGYLAEHGEQFPLRTPFHYYLAAGTLSSVLDNAPTYLNFLRLQEVVLPPSDLVRLPDGTMGPEQPLVDWLLAQAPASIVAISLGSVFFGAMTYIGNGPNFMVKSIAEAAKVRVPSFFGYVLRYSVPILLPILLAVGWLFLRG